MSKSEMKRLSAQMSDKDRSDRLAARCASQMDKIAEQNKRIKELEGALRTLVISAASLDNAFTLGCRFRDNERYPEIACGLVNLRTFIERARAALKGE